MEKKQIKKIRISLGKIFGFEAEGLPESSFIYGLIFTLLVIIIYTKLS